LVFQKPGTRTMAIWIEVAASLPADFTIRGPIPRLERIAG